MDVAVAEVGLQRSRFVSVPQRVWMRTDAEARRPRRPERPRPSTACRSPTSISQLPDLSVLRSSCLLQPACTHQAGALSLTGPQQTAGRECPASACAVTSAPRDCARYGSEEVRRAKGTSLRPGAPAAPCKTRNARAATNYVSRAVAVPSDIVVTAVASGVEGSSAEGAGGGVDFCGRRARAPRVTAACARSGRL